MTKISLPDRRGAILSFEKALSQIEGATYGDNENCPLKHSFCGNTYVREIFIPKGSLLTGKIHRHEHPNFLMKGDVSMVTEEGVERIQAPYHTISKPGIKRVIYTHEDTVWVTVHEVGKERDLKKIEEDVISKTYEDMGLKATDNILAKNLIKELKEGGVL